MKTFREIAGKISSVILGIVLLGGGVLKLQDPVGAGLVMEEYLNFLHLGFLRGLSTVLGVGFAFIESIVGAALVCGVWTFISWVAAGALMVLFTILTLLLLIFNPAMDCGCFGEAVKLTHAQSFIKNLVLLALWGLSYKNVGFNGLIGGNHSHRYLIWGLEAAIITLFMITSLNNLPKMDFTSMAQGTELFGYDNPDGTLLSVYDADYEEYIEDWSEETLIISAYKPLTKSQKKRVNEFIASHPENVICISTDPAAFEKTYTADRRTILALNRSNGGLTYVSDGQVVGKWHNRRLPEASTQITDNQQIATGRRDFGLVCVGLLLILLV